MLSLLKKGLSNKCNLPTSPSNLLPQFQPNQTENKVYSYNFGFQQNLQFTLFGYETIKKPTQSMSRYNFCVKLSGSSSCKETAARWCGETVS